MIPRVIGGSVVVCFGLILSVSPTFASNQKHAPAFLMAVIGDSVPTGTLADTEAEPPEEAELQYFDYSPYDRLLPAVSSETAMSWTPRHFWKRYSFFSIIGSINWPGFLTNRQTWSWASGKRLNSHFVRLKSWVEDETRGKETLAVKNLAIPGIRVEHLPDQAERLVEELRKNHYLGLKYLVIMVGANDVCRKGTLTGTSPGEMKKHFRRTFEILGRIEQPEPIRVLVASIPRIPDLGLPNLAMSHSIYGIHCGELRKKELKYCQSIIHWNTDAEYWMKLAVVEEKNQALESVVKEVNAEGSRFSVIFSESVTNRHVFPSEIAADCFHPNARGQQAISDMLWDDQPWFK